MAASLSLTASSRLLSPFYPPSKSLLHHAYFGDSVHAKPSLRGTLCAPLAGFRHGFEGADLLIGELFTRAECLIYTVADAAVSSSDVVTSTTAGTKQNSDWLSGSQGWAFYLAHAIRLRICNYSPKNKSPFQRTYAAQIKKCGEMACKIRFFEDQMSKAGLTPSIKSVSPADISVDDLEIKIGELEAELVKMNANNEKLGRSYNELVEYKLVLQKPFWKVIPDGTIKGQGVVGVLEANFIEPAHDKQDFERSALYIRLEARLKQTVSDYCRNNCHLVGYQSPGASAHKVQKGHSFQPALRTVDTDKQKLFRGIGQSSIPGVGIRTNQPISGTAINGTFKAVTLTPVPSRDPVSVDEIREENIQLFMRFYGPL